jgi:glutamyl-tRNA reductase
VIVVGVSHRTATLAERERVALADAGARALLRRLARDPHVSEAVVVSTCNRTELYAAGGGEDRLRRSLGVAPTGYALHDIAAVEHLFRVAAGLDSAVIGESEIVSQLRAAVALAAAEDTLGLRLEEAFASALSAGRRVRRQTGIGRGSTSLAAVVAKAALAERRERGVLLIGAGRVARAVAGALHGLGPPELMIANRTFARARALARQLGAEAIAWEELDGALARADVVISATAAPGPVLSAARLAAVQPRAVFDLAVPRDVEPAAAAALYDLEALQARLERNRAVRRADAQRAAALVRAEVARFADRRRERDLGPLIEAVWRRAEETRREEIARCGPLPAGELERLDRVTSALVRKLLDGPSRRLRTAGDPERLDAFRDLFGVEARRSAA